MSTRENLVKTAFEKRPHSNVGLTPQNNDRNTLNLIQKQAHDAYMGNATTLQNDNERTVSPMAQTYTNSFSKMELHNHMKNKRR